MQTWARLVKYIHTARSDSIVPMHRLDIMIAFPVQTKECNCGTES